jgi:hypothetical protein
MDVFHGDGMKIELNALKPERWIEINFAGGVGVARAGEVVCNDSPRRG